MKKINKKTVGKPKKKMIKTKAQSRFVLPAAMSLPGDAAEDEGYNTEFRSYPDNAWYSVRVLFEAEFGDTLRVKYENFGEDHDHVFVADDFKSRDEVCDFFLRFRTVSAQLQDWECSKVVKGLRVCASDAFGKDDVRFYDAIVEDVLHKKHSNVNGEEVCECTFLLSWLHGPNVGNVADKGVADVCLVQSSELQPRLASFMEIALQKIEKGLCKSVYATTNDLACNHVAEDKDNKSSANVEHKPSFSGHLTQGKYAMQPLSTVWPFEGGTEVVCAIEQEDIDVGGGENFYIILVRNLEKELSSSTASEFIHKQTSIAARVYVFPSLPWETYTNGVIMLDCQKDLERLFVLLQSPNHFIVSSSGRPWVANEKMLLNDHWALTFGSPNKLLNRSGARFSNELKIVCYGTTEYTKAKEWRDLFSQFSDHQRGLYKTLSMEERSIS